MRLDEKYRPRRFCDVVGQDKAVRQIQTALKSGEQVFALSGKSGTGKTTLARIIAESKADPFNITELAGPQLTIPTIRELRDRWRYVAMGEKPGYALVVNEYHIGLRRDVIVLLLDFLENLPSNVYIIFTTTCKGDDLFAEEHVDAGPFKSRCTEIVLAQRDLNDAFAAHLKWIAELENLDGKPLKAYKELLNQNGQNLRAGLKHIANGGMRNGDNHGR